jgi:TonB family protein
MTFQALLFCPDEKTARVTTQVLNELEFSVEACSEPFAAVKKLMGQHFDAIVVDCDNEQNASLLFKSARNSNSNQASLSVAVVEGQTGVANAFRLGANLVLTKPINVEQAKSTLRVARGLLRKGGDAKSATTATPAAASPSASHTGRPSSLSDAARPASGLTSASKPAVAAFQPPKPTTAAAIAKTSVDPGTVFDIDDEQAQEVAQGEEILFDAPVEAPSKNSVGVSTKDYAWQPPAKPADAMSAAMRRAAEAADSLPPVEATPSAASAKPAFEPPTRSATPSSATSFSGAASAPARAKEVPAPAQRIVPASVAPSSAPALSTAPLPVSYEAEEDGGSKKKLIGAAAAVVLIAAGYFGWSAMHGKSDAPKASAQTAAPAKVAQPATASAQTSAPQATQEIEIAVPTASTSSGTQHSAAAPSGNRSTRTSADEAEDKEPEVTVTHPDAPKQTLVVKSESKTSKPAVKEPATSGGDVPAPALVASGGDPSAISNIMQSAPAAVPRVAAPREAVKVSQGVTQGLLLKRVQPNYPAQARQLRIQGAVQLQATIAKSGDITSVKVLNGEPALARAAVDAVRQWKYKPYYLNGEPVDIQTQITINFKLP